MQTTTSTPESDTTFSVGVDAIVVGDDGRGGLLAASLRYASRLAKAMSHVLDLGELTHLETTGSRTVITEVSWDLAGECRLRGQVIESKRPASPTAASVPEGPGGTDGMDAVIDVCLSALESCDSVRWAALFRRDLPPLHTTAMAAGATLGQVGLRALGILGGIDEELRETCVWLGYDRGTLVLAPVGPHCLVISVDTDRLDAGPLLASVEETQARLAPYDLTTAAVRPRRVSSGNGSPGIVGPPRLIGSTGAGGVPRAFEGLIVGQGTPLTVGPFGSAVDASDDVEGDSSRRVLRRPPMPLTLRR
ncbi:hypothetical protein [Nocardioides gilvus]|uniref:hypothetical protein n=1 Tax=Nocardioides gilvus TaxID=1735589 RepID=UPI000D74982C|nr:hypothetical protein [Nocardioides gilvus]